MAYFPKPNIGSIINSRSIMADKLVGCYLLNERSGAVHNIAIRNYIAATAPTVEAPVELTGGAVWMPEGIDFSADDAAVNIGTATKYKFTVHDFTFHLRMTFPSSLVANLVFICKGVYNTAGYYIQQNNTSGALSFVSKGAASRITTTNNGVVAAGKTYSVTITRQGTSVLFYVDGNLVSLAAVGSHDTIVYPSEYNFYIGRYNTASVDFDGKIHYLYVWERCLNRYEVPTLQIDPYCFISHMPIWMLFQEATPAAGHPAIRRLGGIHGAVNKRIW